MANDRNAPNAPLIASLDTQIDLDPVLKRMQQIVQDRSPHVDYEYVDVQFGTADTDKEVLTRLQPRNPNSIDYQQVRSDVAGITYHDHTPGRRPWGKGYIIVRNSAADANVRLLLIERKERN